MSLSERDKKELIKHIQIEGTKEKPFMSDLETALFEARVRNFLVNEMKEEGRASEPRFHNRSPN